MFVSLRNWFTVKNYQSDVTTEDSFRTWEPILFKTLVFVSFLLFFYTVFLHLHDIHPDFGHHNSHNYHVISSSSRLRHHHHQAYHRKDKAPKATTTTRHHHHHHMQKTIKEFSYIIID
ncbi:hypothetical protein G9A89_009758 [Geosiphon pyriformis]|nr:hypothetical protein G9A89_009758 [Geosiphon pyriformis]